MKGIREGLTGLLLIACAQILPAQGGSISLNASGSGELLQQGTFPASPTDVYSHSPTLQALSYEFLGFNPAGTATEERQRSGYVVFDLSGVTDTILDATLAFDVNVIGPDAGSLQVNTITPADLGDVMAAPVGPLTQAQFDSLLTSVSSGIAVAAQNLATGLATLNLSLGAAGTSHLSSAAGLVGFQVLFQTAAFQASVLNVESAPRLLLTTLSPDVVAVPSAGTLALVSPGVLALGVAMRRRHSRKDDGEPDR